MHARGSPATPSESKTQAHYCQCNYWPARLWDIAWPKEVATDQKYSEICDFNLKIGLRHPNDETVKQCLAMIAAGGGQESHNTPGQNYDAVHKFKGKVHQKRDLYPGAASCKVFPENADDFQAM